MQVCHCGGFHFRFILVERSGLLEPLFNKEREKEERREKKRNGYSLMMI